MRMMNSVYPENKRDLYVTSLSLSCAVGTSVIFFPLFSPLLRVPYYIVGLLYHSLFRKNLKWTQVPRSSLLREAIAEGRLSVAMRKLWEAGSRPRSAVQETCCRGCCLWARLPGRCQAQWLYGTDMENRAEVTVKEHYATTAKIFPHPEITVDNQ